MTTSQLETAIAQGGYTLHQIDFNPDYRGQVFMAQGEVTCNNHGHKTKVKTCWNRFGEAYQKGVRKPMFDLNLCI